MNTALLASQRAEIEAELKNSLAYREFSFYNLLRYHLGWVDSEGNPVETIKGKALRSTLCLLACKAVGGDSKKALPAAVAVELLHNFTLIHDDVQDGDSERRGRPTVWAIWGKPQAINAGDAMHALATLNLFRLRERGVSPDKVLQALRILEESCLKIIEGQYLDLSFEEQSGIRVETYLEMVERKTALLFEGAAWTGALLGTEDEELIVRLRSYGKQLGLAFQIKDDILGIWGEEGKTGKPQGTDIRRRKKTLPVVHALERNPELDQIYRKEKLGEEEISMVLEILERSRSRNFAQRLAEEHSRRAISEMAELPLISPAKEGLKELARFSIQRDF